MGSPTCHSPGLPFSPVVIVLPCNSLALPNTMGSPAFQSCGREERGEDETVVDGERDARPQDRSGEALIALMSYCGGRTRVGMDWRGRSRCRREGAPGPLESSYLLGSTWVAYGPSKMT